MGVGGTFTSGGFNRDRMRCYSAKKNEDRIGCSRLQGSLNIKSLDMSGIDLLKANALMAVTRLREAGRS